MSRLLKKKYVNTTYMPFIIVTIFFLSVCVSHAKRIKFNSKDAGSTTIIGYLNSPKGDGPFHAVIVLHGSFGLNKRTKEWGGWLASQGYISLVVDSKTTRGNIAPYRTMMLDAAGAMEYLRSNLLVEDGHIGVMGFSQGGAAALEASRESNASQFTGKGLRSAVAFYPPCQTLRRDTNIPTLLLLGEDDNRTFPDGCISTAKELQNEDKKVFWEAYKRAGHSFDTPGTPGYNANAAARAKRRVRDFLAQYLR